MGKIDEFLNSFPDKDYSKFFCPGRVNLIGEHIDYNGGQVLPYALEYGIYGVAKLRNDNKLIFKSDNVKLVVERDLDDLKYRVEDNWTNYPKGIIKEFKDRGYPLSGMEINYYGNIPNGAGLSSSAAIEVLTCKIVDSLNNLNTDKISWVKWSQRVENEYIGVNCGIMDQFVVCMGKKDKAILLDCNTLDYKYTDVNIEDSSFVIINTNKKRVLSDSKYNERRKECEEGLKIIQKYMNIEYLCDIKLSLLNFVLSKIENPLIKRRVKHVITENARVCNAIEVLEKGDIEALGNILNLSHFSLKNDYEVTGFELDALAEEARKIKGVYGSRMTGAGFGGCTITLVEKSEIDNFSKKIKENYKKKTGLDCSIYYSGIGSGVKKL